jgi:hypothetical protein
MMSKSIDMPNNIIVAWVHGVLEKGDVIIYICKKHISIFNRT